MGCNSSKNVQVSDPSKKPGDRPNSASSTERDDGDDVNEISQTQQDDVATDDS